jgi:hypothetical protein
VLALVYAAGQRPDAESLYRLSSQAGLTMPFSLSHVSGEQDPWVELLSGGLTYDCHWLAAGEPDGDPSTGAMLGLHELPVGEAITLKPSPHLAEGGAMIPVVRVMAGLAAELARLPGLQAVYWYPANCWMAPKYFCGVIADWLGGGAFPSLGFASLKREPDGTMVSVGLDFLIGQELRFEPDRRLVAAAIARIAVRLIHRLVEVGPLSTEAEFVGPEGERLLVEPVRQGKQLKVTVRR